jgi:DNA-binding HxlR family transcriptional regulator
MSRDESKLDIIRFVARPYVIEVLNALKEPKRYKELKLVCNNDKTLAKRIKELNDLELIEPVAVKSKSKYANFYSITKKGLDILKKIEKLRT